MEGVLDAVGERIGTIFRENGITTMPIFQKVNEDTAIRLLGLTVGDWIAIRDIQDRFASLGTSVQQPVPVLPPLSFQLGNGLIISPDGVKQVISASTVYQVQQLVNGKLKDGEKLSTKEKLHVSRAVCSHYFQDMVQKRLSVVLEAKTVLAKSIVEAYDCLKSEDVAKPPESDWFYKNNGETTGEHTGFIQNWLHNNKKKYRDPAKSNKRKAAPYLTSEISKALDELDDLTCDPGDLHRAKELIKTTLDCRSATRALKGSSATILADFRQFLAFDGLLIHYEFDLMYPSNAESPSYAEIGRLCRVLSDDFNDIACDGIRMLMAIKSHLKHRGIAIQQNADNLPPLEEDVATFVWFMQTEDDDLDAYKEMSSRIGPLIACANIAFAVGDYAVFIDGQSVWTGSDFYRAFDLWFKAHLVLGLKYSPKAKPTMEFFEILMYNIKRSSRAAGVNALVSRIKNSL